MAVEKALPIKNFLDDVPRTGPAPDGATTTAWRFPELRSQDAKGNSIRTEIRVEVHNLNNAAMILNPDWLGRGFHLPDGLSSYIYTDVTNEKTGKLRDAKPQVVMSGKNIGRANETNVFTQALSEARAIYNKKLQLVRAPDRGAITFKRYPPMLVTKAAISDKSVRMPDRDTFPIQFDDGPVYFQRKHNGIRAVIVDGRDAINNPPPEVIIYGRTMKDISGNDQIRTAFIPVITRAWELYGVRVYFDCEIYTHGMPLQEISGEARKEKDSGKLHAYVFDCFVPEGDVILDSKQTISGPALTYDDRRKMLDTILGDNIALPIVKVQSFLITSEDEALIYYRAALAAGYEGGIIRYGNRPYQYSYNGYHSRNIMKMKPLLSDEFEMVRIEAAKKGKAAGNIVMICSVPGKPTKTFHVTFKDMTEDAQKEMYRKLLAPAAPGDSRTVFDVKYKGKPLTVDYYELSKDGAPLMAKAVAIRDYE